MVNNCHYPFLYDLDTYVVVQLLMKHFLDQIQLMIIQMIFPEHVHQSLHEYLDLVLMLVMNNPLLMIYHHVPMLVNIVVMMLVNQVMVLVMMLVKLD